MPAPHPEPLPLRGQPLTPCLFCGRDRGNERHHRCDVVDPRHVAQIVDVDDDDPRGGSIAERAERFHRRNPHVYDFAVQIARSVKRRGVAHYGIRPVWEVMRYTYLVTHGEAYKLNDHYHAWYARRIMALEPDLAGFFKTRHCPNDEEYYIRQVKP